MTPAPRWRSAAVRPRRASALRDRPSILAGAICAAGVLAAAGRAFAAPPDIGLSASLTSDYRYRGLSFSDGLPAVSASISYDHPSGAYFSATAIAGPTPDDGLRVLGYQAYVGYARRVGGVSLDVGLAQTDFTAYLRPRYRVRYAEAYVGAALGHASLRVSYAPDYLGEDTGAVYVDAGAWLAPAADWRLVGHVGVLAPVHPGPYVDVRRRQYDARLGLARLWPRWRAELAWTGVAPGVYEPPGYHQSRNALLLTATRYF